MIIVNLVGRFGNILFELFCGYTIALRYNLKLAIINKDNESSIFKFNFFNNILYINKNKNMDDYIKINEEKTSYSDILSNIPVNKNLILNGYFQSVKYFKEYFEVIKNNFDFKTLEIAKKIMKDFKNDNKKEVICIHIRGTDYLKLKNYHNNLGIEYYKKSLKCVEDIENKIIILFTDDQQYVDDKFFKIYNLKVKEIIEKYIPNNFSYLRNNEELEFFLISCCDYIICANSTFSLWASYFSNAQKIYIPRNWFGKDGPKDFNIDDLCLRQNFHII